MLSCFPLTSDCDPCRQDREGDTPLIVCCKMLRVKQTNTEKYVRILQILLQDNCGINMCDNEGKNALMYACLFAMPEIVELLLSHKKCNPCQQDKQCNTPLIACFQMLLVNQTDLRKIFVHY